MLFFMVYFLNENLKPFQTVFKSMSSLENPTPTQELDSHAHAPPPPPALPLPLSPPTILRLISFRSILF